MASSRVAISLMLALIAQVQGISLNTERAGPIPGLTPGTGELVEGGPGAALTNTIAVSDEANICLSGQFWTMTRGRKKIVRDIEKLRTGLNASDLALKKHW